MTPWRRAAMLAALLTTAMIPLMPGESAAQAAPTVTASIPVGDPIPAAFPIVVRVAGLTGSEGVVVLSLEVSTTTAFLNNLLSETQVGETATFVMLRPLPENATVYFRVRARDAAGRLLAEEVTGPRRTGPHLVLTYPAGLLGVTVFTRFPRFTWRSAPVSSPPGPWKYDLRVVETSTGTEAIVARDLDDTTYTPQIGLQANAPYLWTVTARLRAGFPSDTVVRSSPANFIIRATGAPVATLLYQNFPNPFPTATAQATCIWFDLDRQGTVSLTLHDLRGNLVRRLIPGQLLARLPAGAYGPVGEGAASGCDDRLQWDGTDGRGRTVPAGVYLLVFRANGVESTKKILFLGR